jgi:hypothetical protein
MIFAETHGFEINNQETSVGGGDEKSIHAGWVSHDPAIPDLSERREPHGLAAGSGALDHDATRVSRCASGRDGLGEHSPLSVCHSYGALRLLGNGR